MRERLATISALTTVLIASASTSQFASRSAASTFSTTKISPSPRCRLSRASSECANATSILRCVEESVRSRWRREVTSVCASVPNSPPEISRFASAFSKRMGLILCSLAQLSQLARQNENFQEFFGQKASRINGPISGNACSGDQVPFGPVAIGVDSPGHVFAIESAHQGRQRAPLLDGASSRTGDAPVARWCSGRCCIWARSAMVSMTIGAARSKRLTRMRSAIRNCLFSLPIANFPDTPRDRASRCGSIGWSCTGRGSGARAGCYVSSTSNSNSTNSGRGTCGPPARERTGATSCRRWCATG